MAGDDYDYYVVESAFVVRVDKGQQHAERYLPDRTWAPYPDVWDVATNGRQVAEEKALQLAEAIFERDAKWDAGQP